MYHFSGKKSGEGFSPRMTPTVKMLSTHSKPRVPWDIERAGNLHLCMPLSFT